MQSTVPSWNVSGIVTDKRALEGKESKKVFKYIVKVMAMGGTFDLSTKDESVYNSVAIGEEVRATGMFEFYRESANFNITKIEAASTDAPKLTKAS